jgi:hypothetical protein
MTALPLASARQRPVGVDGRDRWIARRPDERAGRADGDRQAFVASTSASAGRQELKGRRGAGRRGRRIVLLDPPQRTCRHGQGRRREQAAEPGSGRFRRDRAIADSFHQGLRGPAIASLIGL